MTMIVGQEDKPSLEELALEHFGVKGMKWGVVRSKLSESVGISGPSGKQIRGARKRVRKAGRQIRKEQVKQLGTFGAKRKARKAKIGDMKLDLLNNPDRATATRITRGEKAALVLFTAPTVAGVAGTAGFLAGRTIKRKVIENRQKTGYYNQK